VIWHPQEKAEPRPWEEPEKNPPERVSRKKEGEDNEEILPTPKKVGGTGNQRE